MSFWREQTRRAVAVSGAWLLSGALFSFAFMSSAAAPASAAAKFREEINPLLQKYCSDCHADGANKGSVSFDEFKSDSELLHPDLWLRVLKNVRAGLMPPPKKDQPTAAEKEKLEHWIKHSAFALDPANPDPGQVVVRRLNRTEYRNTIRDLLGVDFNTENEFPADDTVHGFDNIGSVLSISPMLLEKYLNAAKQIVSQAVPEVSRVMAEQVLEGKNFKSLNPTNTPPVLPTGALALSYYEQGSVSNRLQVVHPGKYEVLLNIAAAERYVDNIFDYNKCVLVFKVDGKEIFRREFTREGAKPFTFRFEQEWKPGAHDFVVEVQPVTPGREQVRALTLRLNSVTVRGPFDKEHYVKPKNYDRFFPKTVPADEEARRRYAKELLKNFAELAYRAPVEQATAERLAALAESIYSQPKETFESGVRQAMIAVLASPRFLYREERLDTASAKDRYPLIDEFSLATRLSYFLWSTMPDAELFSLARSGQLRQQLPSQVKRMLKDPRAEEFVRNFSGQWLQARDIETVQIEARAVRSRELGTNRPAGGPGEGRQFRRVELDAELRKSMRKETELYFGHIVKEDRSVLELIDSNYTFLNERLAGHYGLTNLGVTGPELRKVVLPEGSPRGGVLTHGTVLVVTSNPTRTSPVKRGMFVLENILGTPPPPPPPNIPSLEEVSKDQKEKTLSLRETLEMHRNSPSCMGCHSRMDPLGLAMENFNAMGAWREQELGLPIDSAGKLVSGESFATIQELKKILATKHAIRVYETITEKLLTYALGRGLDYYDVETIDHIAERLEKENGRFSAALVGVIESAAFQRSRRGGALATFDRGNTTEHVTVRIHK